MFFLCFFTTFTTAYVLNSTQIVASLSYPDSSYDFSLYMITPCCRVNSLTNKCNIWPEGDTLDQATITYDKETHTLNVDDNLPEGEYEIWVYRYTGDNFYNGEPVVKVTIPTEDGMVYKEYIVDNLVDSNTEKYRWWNIANISSFGMVNYTDNDYTLVSSLQIISNTISYEGVECESFQANIAYGLHAFVLLIITLLCC
ncbi:Uncharacterized protein QTN25_006381 [Entamoeba marina]